MSFLLTACLLNKKKLIAIKTIIVILIKEEKKFLIKNLSLFIYFVFKKKLSNFFLLKLL
jgi:hypothetical protein